MPILRVIAPGTGSSGGGQGWVVVALEAASVAGQAADCWFIDSSNLALICVEDVARSGLPLVVRVDDTPIAAAWLDCADGYVLAGDDDAVVAAMLATVTTGHSGFVVADQSGDVARTMNALSIDASRIAEQLARLAAEQDDQIPVRGVDAVLVRRIIKLRRARDRYFPAEVFADPAWDMLLDLMAARLEAKQVPVSSLCIAAAVPTTTALRWVRSLTAAGVIDRRSDPSDARRSHVELSTPSVAAMTAYLHSFNAVFSLR